MHPHELLYQGSRFGIYAYRSADGRCEVLEFLQDRQVLSQADEDALQDLFIRHGDHGPIHDDTKSKPLGDGLWEYKARHGGRIAWFYAQGAIVICACGTVKKKPRADPNFIERARKIKQQFEQGA